uniref:hypothetical protein n=1 Tax=Alloprevotella sp. TaxID=1872471 RepID=UPI0040286F1A
MIIKRGNEDTTTAHHLATVQASTATTPKHQEQHREPPTATPSAASGRAMGTPSPRLVCLTP